MRLVYPILLFCLLHASAAVVAVAEEDALDTDCECLWQGSFAKVQATSDLVLSAQVIGTKGNSIDLQPEQILAGETPATTRVWLKARNYCRPLAAQFPPGSRWVFALHKIRETPPDGFDPGTPNVSYGRVGDFTLSSCGGYWLKLDENYVTGNLVGAPRWVREPKMSPVLLDVVAAFIKGNITIETLAQATKVDPALRDLMLDTRSFLRNGE
ncbi:MAG: delta-aminolevulinic acid dehydratase [Halioglobus sp.]